MKTTDGLPHCEESNGTSETMRRCEELIRKHAPGLMKTGQYIKEDMPKPKKRKGMTETKILCITTMHETGQTSERIAKLMHCTKPMVEKVLKTYFQSKLDGLEVNPEEINGDDR